MKGVNTHALLTMHLFFEDSCQMPWTHYEVSVKLNTESDGSILKVNNLGASMIMFTSESDNGTVTQITKYRTTTQEIRAY